MQEIDYELVVDALYDADLQPCDEHYESGDTGYVRIHNDYSGRAMYGDECFGIDFDSFADAFAFVASFAVKQELLNVEDADGSYVDPVNFARETRTDQMGLGIITYWPGYRLVNVPVDEEVNA